MVQTDSHIASAKGRTALALEPSQQAMFCLHWSLRTSLRPRRPIESALLCFHTSYDKKHTGNTQLATLVKDTQALAALVTTEKVVEDTARQEALVCLVAVAGLDLLVAAGDLGLVAALVLSLLEGQLFGIVVGASRARESSDGGGEEGSDGEELHCECVEEGIKTM